MAKKKKRTGKYEPLGRTVYTSKDGLYVKSKYAGKGRKYLKIGKLV